MSILLSQVAVIISMLTIGTFTNRLELESPEISLRSGGSLGTKRKVLKRLPAPRGYKKSVARLGATRVGGNINVVGEVLHWGTKKPFSATREAKRRN